jgi:hypothetical protein
VLGTGGNTDDAINLGNGAKLVLTTGATIGVFTESPGTLAAGDTSDAIGGAVLSGEGATLTEGSGTLTVGGGNATLAGASDGDSAIVAGADFTGV